MSIQIISLLWLSGCLYDKRDKIKTRTIFIPPEESVYMRNRTGKYRDGAIFIPPSWKKSCGTFLHSLYIKFVLCNNTTILSLLKEIKHFKSKCKKTSKRFSHSFWLKKGRVEKWWWISFNGELSEEDWVKNRGMQNTISNTK